MPISCALARLLQDGRYSKCRQLCQIEEEMRESKNSGNWQSANYHKGFRVRNLYNLRILQLHCRGRVTSHFDSSTVCIFGESAKKPGRCTLITFNTKRQETVIAEVDYRMACSIGCVNCK